MTWTRWWRLGGVFDSATLVPRAAAVRLKVLSNIRRDHEDGTLQKPVFLHIKTAPSACGLPRASQKRAACGYCTCARTKKGNGYEPAQKAWAFKTCLSTTTCRRLRLQASDKLHAVQPRFNVAELQDLPGFDWHSLRLDFILRCRRTLAPLQRWDTQILFEGRCRLRCPA